MPQYRRSQDEPGGGGNSDPAGLDINIPDYNPNAKGPIGVPDDYVATRPRVSHIGDVGSADAAAAQAGVQRETPPQYYDGDEFAPGQQSPDEIAQLQRTMASIGLLSPNTRFRLGVWDESSQKAYRGLLAYANQQGLDFRVAMMNLMSTGGNYKVDEHGNIVSVDQAPDISQLPTKTTNPEDLRQVFRAAVIDTLGQGWGDDKINQMIGAYNQAEIAQQQQSYQAELSGGNVESVASPQAFATSYAQEQDPSAAAGQNFLDYTDEFGQMLQSGAWGVQ